MTVRSANLGANFVASFRSIGGGEVKEYTQLVYESRQEVMHRMVQEAQRRGANAVVGMRFDTGEIAASFSEVCAYGTAVVVSPRPPAPPGATALPPPEAPGGPSAPPPPGGHGYPQDAAPDQPAWR